MLALAQLTVEDTACAGLCMQPLRILADSGIRAEDVKLLAGEDLVGLLITPEKLHST